MPPGEDREADVMPPSSADSMMVARRHPAVWIIQIGLAVYLLPVVAIVAAIGGVAIAGIAVGRHATGMARALARPSRRRPSRIRHEPHVALPVPVTAARSCR